MAKTKGHILKGGEVKLEGQFHLDVGKITLSSAEGAITTSGEQQVRVVEHHPDFGVLELSCSCGTKTYIRCEYNNGQADDKKPEQTKTDGENNNAN